MAMNTAVVFENLQLDIISNDWVKTCWDADLSDFSSVPNETKELLEETDFLLEQLKAVHTNLGTWLHFNNENANGEGLWSILLECEISHKSLVSLLAYLCHNATKISSRFCEKAAGLLAASVYLRLVALPGSAAFKIYNPELLIQACNLLTLWNSMDYVVKGKKKRSEVTKTRNRKGHKKKTSGEILFEEDTVEANRNENEEDDIVELTGVERGKLDDLKKMLLNDIITICEKFSLRQSESTVIQLLSMLTNMCKQDSQAIDETMGRWNGNNCSFGILGFKCIYLLCQPFHGNVSGVVNETFKQLLDHILMMEEGKLYSTLGKPVLLMRRHALDFIIHLVKDLGDRSTSHLKTLLQNICFKIPDKTDYRQYGAEAVCELIEYLPDLEYAKLLEWFKRLSKYNKVCQRSFVVEIILALMNKPERKLSDNVPSDIAEFSSHKSMVCILLSRCSDSNASIRSRALVGFSVCANSKFRNVVSTIRNVITPVAVQSRPAAKHFMPTPVIAFSAKNMVNSTFKEAIDNTLEASYEQAKDNLAEDVLEVNKNVDTPEAATRSSVILQTPGFNPYLPDTEGVSSMFRRRIVDTKVIVRKSAVQALQKVLELEAPSYCLQDLQILQERCADPALSVRKQAVQSLLELLKLFPNDRNIQKSWLLGLLPQVMDRETSVQEKCFDLLEEMILLHLKPSERHTTTSSIEWDLLTIIADETNENLRRYLQKACQYWTRTKKLKPAVVAALLSHINGVNDKAAWMFLSEISKTPVKIDSESVIIHWKTVKASEDESSYLKWSNVLTVLASTAKFISPDQMPNLVDDMKKKLRKFTYPLPIIAGMVNCVSKFENILEMSQRQFQGWGEDIMIDCDNYMSQIILNAENNVTINEDQLIRYMFTLGEVCQRCPTRMPKRVTLLIQSIIASPCIENISPQTSGGMEDCISPCKSQNVLTSPTKSAESPESQASSQSSQPLSQFKGSKMSGKLRAHAFIALGKLCLVDENLAKKTIAALARELELSDCPAVRNNVVILMADLTIRYTTLVDRYVTNIAACLKDSSALVRKNTLTILTRLLQEEYVKWKGTLFFYYITTLLDQSEEIKQLAEFCLQHLLLQKHPNLFFHPFIECIFHFNNYQNHPVYNKFKQTEEEKKKFCLAGQTNFSSRMQLYTFMLEHMTDEQKFKITAKINKEILSAIVDKVIPLDAEGAHLLIDALAILSCKEIKLSTMKNRGNEDGHDETAQDMAHVVTVTAKKVLITHVVKKNVIENIVPVVISLKHILEKSRSPLLKNLMEYIRELMKDYKTEIKDILAADRQLAQEIAFDLRNFENQQDEALTQPRASAPQTNSPASSRPTSPVVQLNMTPPPVPLVLREVNGGAVSRSGHPSPGDTNQPRPSVLSIMDAAKRAMTRVDRLRQSENRFTPPRSPSNISGHKTSSNNTWRSSQKSIEIPEVTENTIMSPVVKLTKTRAISTPTNEMNNVTFAQVGNMTMIPPSPIPSVASAINGGKLCISPKTTVEQKGKRRIIHMPHPEAKEPEPVKWNIVSPAKKHGKSSAANDEAGSTTPTRKNHLRSSAGMKRNVRPRR